MRASTSVAALNAGMGSQGDSAEGPLVWDFKKFAEMAGVSIATLIRCEQEDANFPTTFRFRPNGKKLLTSADGREYINRKRKEAAAAR